MKSDRGQRDLCCIIFGCFMLLGRVRPAQSFALDRIFFPPSSRSPLRLAFVSTTATTKFKTQSCQSTFTRRSISKSSDDLFLTTNRSQHIHNNHINNNNKFSQNERLVMTPKQKQLSPDALASSAEPCDQHQHEDKIHQSQSQSQKAQHCLARKVYPDALAECGARLRAGELVAFPTETVYGLGCHALDPAAIQKVFDAKERPLTDPLIVHVATVQDALDLWENNDDTNNITTTILETVSREFWPGPLTLVAKAAPHVPSIVMANTGFVACRCPSHPLAQALIRHAQCPIAAPSANKFGHVSPTQADHVMDDLGQENVWVLEDNHHNNSINNNDNSNNRVENKDHSSSRISCQVGVESTVAKLEEVMSSNSSNNNINNSENTSQKCQFTLTVLRQGAISVQDLQKCLDKAGISCSVRCLSQVLQENEAAVAPGQAIKHYSPRIPSFLLAPPLFAATSAAKRDQLAQFMRESIVLDFGGRLEEWKSAARQYRDLSPSGDSSQAAQCVFESLRWAERIDPDARCIVFPQVVVSSTSTTTTTTTTAKDNKTNLDALTLALHDRLTRAASGVVLDSVANIQKKVPPSRP